MGWEQRKEKQQYNVLLALDFLDVDLHVESVLPAFLTLWLGLLDESKDDSIMQTSSQSVLLKEMYGWVLKYQTIMGI